MHIFNALISFILLTNSLWAADTKKDLYAIFGSIRVNLYSDNHAILDKFHGIAGSDCTHMKSFSGQATTFDTRPCKDTAAAHIVGDATTYDFSSYRIQHAYLERLPTTKGLTASYKENNLIGGVINNIAPHMPRGAHIEVELDPFLQFLFQENYAQEIMTAQKANPFHAWHSFTVAYIGLSNISNPHFSEDDVKKSYTQEMVVEILKYKTDLERWLRFLAQQTGISFEDLAERVYLEMKLYDELLNPNPGKTMLALMFPDSARLSIEDFKKSVENTRLLEISPEDKADYLSIGVSQPDKDGKMRTFRRYGSEFFNESVSNAVLAMYAVEQNKVFITEYMEKAGFENVSIEIKKSPHNQRENFWIVSATKK